MAENAGQASIMIADRVRDPQFIGTTQQQVISLLSYSQQIVNGALSDIVATTSLPIQPRTLIYQLSGFIPAAIKVLAVTDASGRDLDPLFDLATLQAIDMRWPTSLGSAPRFWVQVGADIIIIYPGTEVPQAVTVTYGQFIPALATAADSTTVAIEDDPPINALTEVLLLLKGRDLNAVKGAMDRFTVSIQELQTEKH
jgi:hypothetical protein